MSNKRQEDLRNMGLPHPDIIKTIVANMDRLENPKFKEAFLNAALKSMPRESFLTAKQRDILHRLDKQHSSK